MMKSRNTNRKPGPLLLALLLTSCVMMTATLSAAESFLSNPNFEDLQDGDVTLARAEHGGAGIHMSFMSPSALHGSSQSSQAAPTQNDTLPNVYLSLRLPW